MGHGHVAACLRHVLVLPGDVLVQVGGWVQDAGVADEENSVFAVDLDELEVLARHQTWVLLQLWQVLVRRVFSRLQLLVVLVNLNHLKLVGWKDCLGQSLRLLLK